jgi:hypothetical protein
MRRGAEGAFQHTAAQARRLGVKGSAKAGASFAGKLGLRSLGLFATGYETYQGYKQGGILGAAKGLGTGVAYGIAAQLVMSAIGSTTLGVGIAAAGVAAGGYALGEAGRSHAKGLRNIEFGGGSQIMGAINSGGAATSRQRAALALQNTHINGRMAMGNEALLMHTQF